MTKPGKEYKGSNSHRQRKEQKSCSQNIRIKTLGAAESGGKITFCVRLDWPSIIYLSFNKSISDFKGWTKRRSKLASRRHKQFYAVSSACFVWLLYQLLSKTSTFFFLFSSYLSSSGRTHVSLLLAIEEQKKVALKPLPHIPALFMTPTVQTAGHKMAACMFCVF